MEKIETINFSEISNRDRANYEYMEAMRDAYIREDEDFKNNKNYRLIDNVIFKIEEKRTMEAVKRQDADYKVEQERVESVEKQRIKDEKSAERKLILKTVQNDKAGQLLDELEQTVSEFTDAEQEAKYNKSLELWTQELEHIELYYITEENKFYYWNDKKWITTLIRESVMTRFNIRDKISWVGFMDAMRGRGRIKDRGVYSFYQDENVCLNMTNRKLWLQPVEGEVNPIFDILMSSLSDGRREIQEHIEQVIYWKWKHPEDYKIPCMVMFGEGGIGKNELVERPLTTLFNGGQVKALNAAMVVGDYSGLLKGNVVTFVDELYGTTKGQMGKFKELVGNKRVNLNPKGQGQETIDATSLIITGGNKIQGALLLDGSSSDRRWSIIHCRRNIVLHTMLLAGEDVTEYETMPYTEMKELEHYKVFEKVMNDNLKWLSDKIQVSAWLYQLEEKWGGMENCPTAYHGEDYKALLGAQKNILEDFCDAVFGNLRFSNISTTAFYEGYRLYVHAYGSEWDKKNVQQRKVIVSDAVEYVLNSGLKVEHVTKKDRIQIFKNGRRSDFTGFKTIYVNTKLQKQDEEFFVCDKFDKSMLANSWFEDFDDDDENVGDNLDNVFPIL